MWGRATLFAAGEHFLGSRWGRNSQNLRSREGFCKKLKGWRGVWGAALAKFFILMLFYVFLHHFLSMLLIFNHLLSLFSHVFLSFSSVLGLYRPPPLRGAVTCQGGGATATLAPPSYVLETQVFENWFLDSLRAATLTSLVDFLPTHTNRSE